MPRGNIRTQMPKLPPLSKVSPKPTRIRPVDGGLLRLRLGGGLRARTDGFLGVDWFQSDSVDYVVYLKKFPWPIDDSVVDTLFVEDYMYTLLPDERHSFMNECGRVLKIGAQLIVKEPHWSSMRSVSDPASKWPPICEATFVYYNKDWRIREKKNDYPITCDFDFGYGFGLDEDVRIRNNEYQQQAIKHWNNAAIDIHVTLTRKS